MEKKKYIIGIDLGTTNSTIAYTTLQQFQSATERDLCQIEQMSILQRTSLQAEEASFLLPSFYYIPLNEELQSIGNGEETPQYCVGEWAKERGSELPQRLVSSAKSWLCHEGIDKRATLLPLLLEENQSKTSVTTVLTSFLLHLRTAWNRLHPDTPFEQQQIFITVPASFDPSARQLVQECASNAHYPNDVVLLEEPLAAFYAWIQKHSATWRAQLRVGDVVLVVDIGGGTTDFTLVEVEQEQGQLALHRIAVGMHLLLGGDNLDLALAYLSKSKLEVDGKSIDEWQLQKLIHLCRQAKEKLLGENPPSNIEITLPGRGKRLVASSLKTSLDLAEVTQILVDGFFPLVSPQEQAVTEKRSGLQQMGLPYAQDPQITRQLAKFLSMTGEKDTKQTDQFVVPTAVLFNGGTLKSFQLRQRLMQQLNQWAETLGSSPVRQLEGADFDFSVSQGAAYYGLIRQGQGVRIKAGTPRSYYIGVADARPAIPGLEPPLKAICVVPFGMEEGSEQTLQDRSFCLVLGSVAQFRFFSHSTPFLSNGQEPQMGSIVTDWKNELTELHPIETEMNKVEGSQASFVTVKIKSKITELGILELWFESDDKQKWRLEFNLRA